MKTKILILIVCSINCFTGNVGATEQTGERLMVGDKAFWMQVLPLEQDSVLARLLHKRLSGRISTGLYRGYVGTWRLAEGKLLLEKIEEYDPEYKLREVDISGIFDAYRENGRIVARWFNGTILAQRGELVGRRERRNEQEIRYFLRKGVVKSEKQIYNTFRESSNGSFFHTIDMLFNGNGMIWEGDSTLNVKIFPNPDGTVNRVKVSRELESQKKSKRRKLTDVQLRDKINRLRKRRDSEKAESRFWRKTYSFWDNREKRFGRHHPYTQEVTACAKLMEDWDVLTLDGKIQPVQLEIKWGEDRSKRINWLYLWREKNQQDSLDMDGVSYRVDGYPLQQSPDLITRLRPHLKGAFTRNQPRGYLARWQITDDRLWLTELRNARTGELIPLAVLDPGNNGEPIEASWYTGTFEIAKGEVLGQYYPLGDTETLEVICEVEQGHVTRKTIYNNYIRPEEDTVAFNYFIQEIRSHDWDSYPELKDRTLHGKLMAYPRTDGVADSVGRVELYVNGGKGEERYHRTVTDPADPWIVLVRRAARVIPRWEVCFIKGKVKPVEIYFTIKQEGQKRQKLPEGTFVIDLRKELGGKVLGE